MTLLVVITGWMCSHFLMLRVTKVEVELVNNLASLPILSQKGK